MRVFSVLGKELPSPEDSAKQLEGYKNVAAMSGAVSLGNTVIPPRFVDQAEASKVSGCWVSPRYRNWAEYTTISDPDNPHGKQGQLHRAMLTRVRGASLEPGQTVDHLCRMRCCFFPGHCEPVTGAENTRRKERAKLLEDHLIRGQAFGLLEDEHWLNPLLEEDQNFVVLTKRGAFTVDPQHRMPVPVSDPVLEIVRAPGKKSPDPIRVCDDLPTTGLFELLG